MVTLACTTVLTFGLLGCAKGSENPRGEGKSVSADETGPVTLTMYQNAAFTQEEFQKYIAEPVKKKFPQITINMIFKDDPKMTHEDMLNKLITGNTVPDILFIDAGALNLPKKLGLAYDMTTLAKSHRFDWERLDPHALEAVKQAGTNGELYAVPFSINLFALFYNKDIFDKFGIAYPKDGMTWSELIEVGKKLERTEGGIKYRGLAPGSLVNVSSPLSLPYVDAGTGLAGLQTDGWKKAVQTFKTIEDISDDKSGGVLPFFQNRNIAMLTNSINLINNIQAAIDKGAALNWDLAEYPSYPDQPNVGPQPVVPALAITANCSHKDAAFQVIEYLTSRDVQEILARNARVSALKDPVLKDLFGADFSGLKGKNVKSIFKSVPAKPAPLTEYDDIVSGELNKAVMDFAKGNIADVNSTLRIAEENANKAIQAAK